MVRFFVPAGSGQHDVSLRLPEPFPANERAHETPKSICMAAAVATGALAILGRNRPGTFIRSVAYLTPIYAADLLVARNSNAQLTTEIMRRDGITDVKPSKLVEWRTHSQDGYALAGTLFALGIATLKRPFPGVTGWQRFLGVSNVGWVLGSYVGEQAIQYHPLFPSAAGIRQEVDVKRAAVLNTHDSAALLIDPDIMGWKSWYWRLKNKYLQMRHSPAPFPAIYRTMYPAHEPSRNSPILPVARPAYIRNVVLQGSVLAGCDHDGAARQYTWMPPENATSDLDTYIGDLKQLKTKYEAEISLASHILAQKEKHFYSLAQEDGSKKLLRSELQLLNNLVESLSIDAFVINNTAADAGRLRSQLANESNVLSQMPANSMAPHMAVETLREYWNRATEYYWLINLAQSDERGKVALESIGLEAKEKQEDLERNMQATTRLLREFEDLVQQAESRDDQANGR